MAQLLTSAVTDSAIFLLLASSFMVIMNVTRILHFAHGTAYMVGAYAGVALYGPFGLVGAAVGALLVGAVFGLACERLVYAQLLRRSATRWVVVMSSLAIFTLGENVIGMIFGDSFKTSLDSSIQGVPIGGPLAWMHWTQWIAVTAVALWLVTLWAIMSHTRLGIFMRAVASNERLAAHTGVPTASVRTAAFLLGSAVAALAGVIKYIDLSAQPTMGFAGGLNAVVAFIVGGMTSVPGVAVA
jgi:branched-subunit amino acid ABC-type transport system permease component